MKVTVVDKLRGWRVFVGYVVISAFIGTGFELLRVPELLLYILRRVRAKTRHQREIALKKVRVWSALTTSNHVHIHQLVTALILCILVTLLPW